MFYAQLFKDVVYHHPLCNYYTSDLNLVKGCKNKQRISPYFNITRIFVIILSADVYYFILSYFLRRTFYLGKPTCP